MISDGDSPVADAKEMIRRDQRRLAVELLEPWVADNPDDASAWATMAAGYFGMEDWGAALAASERVTQLRGTARDWCNHGTALRKLGRLKEAERAQYTALTIEADYEHARSELRKLHLALTKGDEEDI